ncbi:MAG: hypothetical protein [Circular genetic element sp.]|nr:MAG: hypothetical protein [Circular genetic element sp.]
MAEGRYSFLQTPLPPPRLRTTPYSVSQPPDSHLLRLSTEGDSLKIRQCFCVKISLTATIYHCATSVSECYNRTFTLMSNQFLFRSNHFVFEQFTFTIPGKNCICSSK